MFPTVPAATAAASTALPLAVNGEMSPDRMVAVSLINAAEDFDLRPEVTETLLSYLSLAPFCMVRLEAPGFRVCALTFLRSDPEHLAPAHPVIYAAVALAGPAGRSRLAPDSGSYGSGYAAPKTVVTCELLPLAVQLGWSVPAVRQALFLLKDAGELGLDFKDFAQRVTLLTPALSAGERRTTAEALTRRMHELELVRIRKAETAYRAFKCVAVPSHEDVLRCAVTRSARAIAAWAAASKSASVKEKRAARSRKQAPARSAARPRASKKRKAASSPLPSSSSSAASASDEDSIAVTDESDEDEAEQEGGEESDRDSSDSDASSSSGDDSVMLLADDGVAAVAEDASDLYGGSDDADGESKASAGSRGTDESGDNLSGSSSADSSGSPASGGSGSDDSDYADTSRGEKRRRTARSTRAQVKGSSRPSAVSKAAARRIPAPKRAAEVEECVAQVTAPPAAAKRGAVAAEPASAASVKKARPATKRQRVRREQESSSGSESEAGGADAGGMGNTKPIPPQVAAAAPAPSAVAPDGGAPRVVLAASVFSAAPKSGADGAGDDEEDEVVWRSELLTKLLEAYFAEDAAASDAELAAGVEGAAGPGSSAGSAGFSLRSAAHSLPLAQRAASSVALPLVDIQRCVYGAVLCVGLLSINLSCANPLFCGQADPWYHPRCDCVANSRGYEGRDVWWLGRWGWGAARHAARAARHGPGRSPDISQVGQPGIPGRCAPPFFSRLHMKLYVLTSSPDALSVPQKTGARRRFGVAMPAAILR